MVCCADCPDECPGPRLEPRAADMMKSWDSTCRTACPTTRKPQAVTLKRGVRLIARSSGGHRRHLQFCIFEYSDYMSSPTHERLEEGAVLLHTFAAVDASLLVEEAERIARSAPFRHLITPGGYTMSVAM